MNKPSRPTLLALSLVTLAACEAEFDTFTPDGDAQASADLELAVELDGASEAPTPIEELPGASELLSRPETEQPLSAPQNLALGMPATQSSTAHGGLASYANDGNTDGFFWNQSVNHTAGGPSWWQVDMLAAQPIGEVVVHNRTDCCAQLLHDFDLEVSLDGVNWESFHQAGIAGDRTRILVDRVARYVRVSNPEVLHMAEVEVFRTRNLAYGKPATQSTTAFGGDASRAVDGNTDGDYGHGSVSHTDDTLPSEWLQVDLEAIESIGQIVLFNRTDCCAAKLHDFVVSVSNDGVNWSAHAYEGPAAQRNVVVPINREARFVRIENGTGYLHLAEVQVFEGPRAPGLSYGRGVGTIPAYGCGVGEVMEAGLCYQPCDPGYTGVLTLCWEDCAQGYTDMGLTCTDWGTLHTYWKGTYDRGIGLLPAATCAEGEDLDASLCYPACDVGYHGVGPVCWRDDLSIEDLSEDICGAFRVPLFAELAQSADVAVTSSLGLGLAVGVTLATELGFAYGEGGEFGCFVSACAGLAPSIEINAFASLGEYTHFSDIAGDSTVASIGYSVGLPIPQTPIALGLGGSIGAVSNLAGDPIGTTLSASASIGIDTPISVSVEGQACHTAMIEVD